MAPHSLKKFWQSYQSKFTKPGPPSKNVDTPTIASSSSSPEKLGESTALPPPYTTPRSSVVDPMHDLMCAWCLARPHDIRCHLITGRLSYPSSSRPQGSEYQKQAEAPVSLHEATDDNFFAANPPPIPQWEWTNLQCRAWLELFAFRYLGLSREETASLADNFTGFGPRIYLMTEADWIDLLGAETGSAVEAWVLSVRNKEGALP